MTRRILKHSIVVLATMGVVSAGCSKKKAAQAAVQATHDPANCPDLPEGVYQLDGLKDSVTKKYFINVAQDKTAKVTILTFNNVETFVTSGKEQPQDANHSKYTVGCVVKNTIKVAGSDPAGKTLFLTIKPAADGGIQVDQDQPVRMSMHYAKSPEPASAIPPKPDPLPKADQQKDQKDVVPPTGIPKADELKHADKKASASDKAPAASPTTPPMNNPGSNVTAPTDKK